MEESMTNKNNVHNQDPHGHHSVRQTLPVALQVPEVTTSRHSKDQRRDHRPNSSSPRKVSLLTPTSPTSTASSTTKSFRLRILIIVVCILSISIYTNLLDKYQPNVSLHERKDEYESQEPQKHASWEMTTPITNTTTTTNNHDIKRKSPKVVKEFTRQDGVVIATKVHSYEMHAGQVKQMLCLLHYAYNDRLNYDILVFTAFPWSASEVQEIQQIVHPTKVSLVLDNNYNGSIQDMFMRNMTDKQQQHLLKRCDIDGVAQLDWELECSDFSYFDPKGVDIFRTTLKYNWQAEFRTRWIWNHPALQNYQWMLWMDTDAFCTEPWKRDPIAMAIQNNLVLLFDNFPWGYQIGFDFEERNYRSFFDEPNVMSIINNSDTSVFQQERVRLLKPHNRLCHIRLENGTLQGIIKEQSCDNHTSEEGLAWINQVHGFFHVTNLKFYRSPIVQRFFQILVGNDESRLRRRYDDQVGVTVPAAILAPDRSWDMASHGFKANVFHNTVLDGKPTVPERWFVEAWNTNYSYTFLQASQGPRNCSITDGG